MNNCCKVCTNSAEAIQWGAEVVGLARDQVKGYSGSRQEIQMSGKRVVPSVPSSQEKEAL